MDILYQQSIVLSALRDTLRDLMKDNFITRAVADKIFNNACRALRKYISNNPNNMAIIDVQGHLRIYRFRKDIWTLYIDEGRMDIVLPQQPDGVPSITCRRSLVQPLKIIAADMRLWNQK